MWKNFCLSRVKTARIARRLLKIRISIGTSEAMWWYQILVTIEIRARKTLILLELAMESSTLKTTKIGHTSTRKLLLYLLVSDKMILVHCTFNTLTILHKIINICGNQSYRRETRKTVSYNKGNKYVHTIKKLTSTQQMERFDLC